MTPRRLTLALALPLVGIALLVARAELKVRQGAPLRVPIAGYDPRDLLRGHYLTFRYAWRFTGPERCEPEVAECCLCVEEGGPGEPPAAYATACEAARTCGRFVRAGDAGPPTRYYVPEARAAELERALRDRRAEVELRVDREGRAVLGGLFLDGRPWEDVVR